MIVPQKREEKSDVFADLEDSWIMKKSDKQVRYQFAAESGLFLFRLGSSFSFSYRFLISLFTAARWRSGEARFLKPEFIGWKACGPQCFFTWIFGLIRNKNRIMDSINPHRFVCIKSTLLHPARNLTILLASCKTLLRYNIVDKDIIKP